MAKSIIGFLRRSYLMVGLFGWPEEKNALIDNPLAKATTPDAIIMNALVESLAKEFDDWEKHSRPSPPRLGSITVHSDNAGYKHHKQLRTEYDNWPVTMGLSPDSNVTCALVNAKRKWKFTFHAQTDCYGDHVWYSGWHCNGVPLSDTAGHSVWAAYEKLRRHYAAIKREADAALKRMQEDEQRWNLAENMLGLKRNEFGALVPKETVDAR